MGFLRRFYIWCVAVALVGLLGLGSVAANPLPTDTKTALHRLLGAWQFTVWLNEKEYKSTVFIDEVRTKQVPRRAKGTYFVAGITRFGSQIIGYDQQAAFPNERSTFQYYISWEDPPDSNEWAVYEFNFISADTLGGVAQHTKPAEKKESQKLRAIGIRVCRHREPCPYR